MLTITIGSIESYNSESEEFIETEGGVFRFEHSLEAISKWESIWKEPFLHAELTTAQMMDYYKLMCLDTGLEDVHLTLPVTVRLSEYMADIPTATVFQNDNKSKSKKVMTSEVLYSLMVSANVPFECASWNVHRLMVLLRVVSINQAPAKKMSRMETLRQNAKLNEERRKKYNTKG